MTKKQLLFATAALTAVALTDTTAHADAEKTTTPVATQQVMENSQAASETTTSQEVSSQSQKPAATSEATVEVKAESAATSEAVSSESASSQAATSESVSSQAVSSKAASSKSVTSAVQTSQAASSQSASATSTSKQVTPKAAKKTINNSMSKAEVYDRVYDRLEATDDKLVALLDKYPDFAYFDNMTDAEFDAFLDEYYFSLIDLFLDLSEYIAVNGSNADLDDLLDYFDEYMEDFEALFLDEEDEEDFIATDKAADKAATGSVNPSAVGASAKAGNEAQTRMAKYHGADANTLPNTGADEQNSLTVAGAALLAGLGALGLGFKKRS